MKSRHKRQKASRARRHARVKYKRLVRQGEHQLAGFHDVLQMGHNIHSEMDYSPAGPSTSETLYVRSNPDGTIALLQVEKATT